MAYFSTEPASERRNATGKNRVWDFFRLSSKTHPANRRQPAQPRRKIGPAAMKPASGIPYWPSRDPIGERGGKNLYEFVGNDGVDRWDYLGMEFVDRPIIIRALPVKPKNPPPIWPDQLPGTLWDAYAQVYNQYSLDRECLKCCYDVRDAMKIHKCAEAVIAFLQYGSEFFVIFDGVAINVEGTDGLKAEWQASGAASTKMEKYEAPACYKKIHSGILLQMSVPYKGRSA